ncbi:MAG: hypothetical protein K2K79_06810 [Paramuribaculum sp.]|nr:hypothetical protein [Paramuribaculum sp.]
MKYLISACLLLFIHSCCDRAASTEALSPAHEEMNSVYYWKTVFSPDSIDLAFLASHNIGRIYLRMFDVAQEPYAYHPEDATYPNASVQIDDATVALFADTLASTEFVPVVYITLEALKAMSDNEGMLANNIVSRVSNMCSYYRIPNVAELQIDCDWTSSTQQSYFRLCDSVKSVIAGKQLPWCLSSTIRLHQLSGQVPPVDRGVLMVYNTGSFNDPDTNNSIIDVRDVEPYLKHLADYPIHLDVAYPTYNWQLLFRQRQFVGLLNGLDLTDTTRFSYRHTNRYIATDEIQYNDIIIWPGDMIRSEVADYTDIIRVKEMIDRRLADKPHSNILYHLDTSNLSNYTPDEISNILSADH